jgi:sialic acid synthase SpsE
MTYIVAEIGVNWNGDIDLARNMIKQAKASGCDAVKFQSYDASIVKDHPEFERLMKCTISEENIDEIHAFAKSSNIDWMCTPMYPEAVDMLEPFVSTYKIREFDARLLLNGEKSLLLDKIFDSDKKIIASSNTIPSKLEQYDDSKLNWLYCVPKYPCSLQDLDFSILQSFDGYSNHCPNIIAPITASILGSKIIEVHITSDMSQDFIDNNVSFDYDALKTMVNLIRDSEKITKN